MKLERAGLRAAPEELALALHYAYRVAPPMARVTVEDCLDREENRFALVIMAAQRSRQLMKNSPPLVHCKNKPLVTSLREIAAGRVRFDRPTGEVVDEWVSQQRLRFARQLGRLG